MRRALYSFSTTVGDASGSLVMPFVEEANLTHAYLTLSRGVKPATAVSTTGKSGNE